MAHAPKTNFPPYHRLIAVIGLLVLLPSLVRADFEVYFMRHGETPWNRATVLQGSIDCADITPAGISRTRECAETFRRRGITFDRVYTSPYRRARHTAQILAQAQGLTPIADARLRERTCGTCESVRYENSENLAVLMAKASGVEAVEAVGDRAMAFFEQELAPLDGKVKRILCVSHTLLLNILESRLSGERTLRKSLLPNTCVHVVAFRNGHFEMKARAQTFYDATRLANTLKQRTVAHRGAGDLTMPEASKAAYADAVAKQSDIVKLDLQRTKDGVIVMGHDPTLKRNMGWDVKIADLPYATILEKGEFRLKGKPSGERIVRLDEALKIVAPIPEFWIDFKYFDPAFAEQVLAAFRAEGIHESRIMVATFSKKALAHFRDHHPQIRRVGHIGFKAGATDEELQRVFKYIDKMDLFGVNMPVCDDQTTLETISALKNRHIWVSLWFVQDEAKANRYRNSGCDAFVTDFVSRVRR